MSTTIHVGDCRTVLAGLPAQSARTCVTSPPYFGLRDYGHAGQIGLERTVDAYVAELVAVFREVRRVLADDGTCWVNLGDSYNAQPGQCKTTDKAGVKQATNTGSPGAPSRYVPEIKPKDLIGVPWRVAFALQADGWWLRQDIIWAKPNPMPESVTDRCTKSHEYIFLLSKQPRYYYDAAAVAEEADLSRAGMVEQSFSTSNLSKKFRRDIGREVLRGATRNKRSVWTVATQPYSAAHFATFPPKLIEPCILAGTSERGQCPVCHKPWVRVVERPELPVQPMSDVRHTANGTHKKIGQKYNQILQDNPPRTTGWEPSCSCGLDPVPDVVLDPFGGAGTTAVVADRLGRDAVIIELNPTYAEMARKRIYDDGPMFAKVEVLA